MLFWEEMDSSSPPSYTEAVTLPAPGRPSTPAQERREHLKPKLCKMEKTSAGYGFHLNGIQGICGQYIKDVRITGNARCVNIIISKQNVLRQSLFQVVTGGAADRAGLEDDDIVVEVNGVNVERSSHEEVVEIIRQSGSCLEMLVATKSVYSHFTDKGVTITRQLLGETSYAQVHSAERPETSREERHEEETKEEQARPETPTEPARERVSGPQVTPVCGGFSDT